MGVTVDGLVSGLDTTSIIEAYTSVWGASTDRLESQQSDLETRVSLLQEFNGYLDDLQDIAEQYTTANDLRVSSAISSSESVLTVTAANGAQPGTYAVEVVSLAQSEMEVSQGYASTSDVVGTSGSITITVAGEDTTIDVSEANGNNTLSTLVDAINDEVDGATAYILNDGGANPYRLVVVSDDTGAANTIEISDTLAGGTAPTFTEQIAAADAEIDMAGLPIYSSTNTFNDVIPGVTMQAVSAGTTTVSVDLDSEGIVTIAQEFVDAYNAVAGFIDDYTGMEEGGSVSSLAGDSDVLASVATSLQTVMSSLFASGDLQGTSILGFATQQDGTLELDTAKLTDALADYPDDALEIMAGENGIFATMDGRLDVVLDPDYGSLALRQESLDDQIDDVQEQIDDANAAMELYEEALRQQFTNLEMVLAQMQSMSTYLTQLFASTSSQ